jgi:aspartyl-tRNA(Asn)/glutamyl-tRNA(Gln) amidotransferase subunit B
MPNILQIQKRMKERPEITRNRLVKNYGIRMQSAIVLVSSPGMLDYFLAVMKFKESESGVRVTNILQGPLMELLNDKKIDYSDCTVKPKDVADIVTFLECSRISAAQSEIVLENLFHGDSRSPEAIVKEEGLEQVSDDSEIEKVCLEVLANNPKLVEGYKRNPAKFQKKILGTLNAVGKGKLNMKKASEIILSLLKKD